MTTASADRRAIADIRIGERIRKDMGDLAGLAESIEDLGLPVEFYDLVESLCPAPRYADLFSRYQHNERWDCHGDQAPHSEATE